MGTRRRVARPRRHEVEMVMARAKKKGLGFDIKPSDIVIPEICPVFGKPLIYGHVDWSPSIDRIDSKFGYIKGNIAIISNKANRTKNDATIEELEAIIEYMKSLRFK